MSSSSLSPTEELAERMGRVLSIYATAEGPQWQQTVDALQSLKGQTLTGLPRRVRRHLDSCLLKINRITAKYPLETFEDYQMVSDEDLDRIRDRLQAIALEYEP